MLLADNIIVKQLLLDKETNTVGSVCIKHMNNFSEFVKVSNTHNKVKARGNFDKALHGSVLSGFL